MKTEILGRQEFVNNQTGMVEVMHVLSIEDNSCILPKIWLGHIITALDAFGQRKIKLAYFLLENMEHNMIIMTMREMAKRSGISLETVRVTMNMLIEAGFLIKVAQSAYKISLDKMFTNETDKLNVLIRYSKGIPLAMNHPTTAEERRKEQEKHVLEWINDNIEYVKIDDLEMPGVNVAKRITDKDGAEMLVYFDLATHTVKYSYPDKPE